jgi:hypothetical protein
VFLIVNAGYLLNTILPLRMGEIGRAFLLQPAGLGFWQVIPTILLERAFDVLISLSIFLGSLPFVLQIPQGQLLVILVGIGVLLSLILLHLMTRYQEKLLAWLAGLTLPWPTFQEGLIDRLGRFLSGLEIMKDTPRFLKAFGWMVLTWGVTLLHFYLLLLAFLPDAKLVWAAFALGAVAVGVTVPSSPGNLGVYEASLVAALTLFGISGSIALAYALLSHFVLLSVTALFGSYTLVQEGLALRNLFAYRRQSAEESEGDL